MGAAANKMHQVSLPFKVRPMTGVHHLTASGHVLEWDSPSVSWICQPVAICELVDDLAGNFFI
jgi:hypothetical protein